MMLMQKGMGFVLCWKWDERITFLAAAGECASDGAPQDQTPTVGVVRVGVRKILDLVPLKTCISKLAQAFPSHLVKTNASDERHNMRHET